MHIEPGMRVRCVDADTTQFLDAGQEYKVVRRSAHPDMIGIVGGRVGQRVCEYVAVRFKPIVRVKALGVGTPPQWRRDMHIFATAGW